jgi:hypothetical protein
MALAPGGAIAIRAAGEREFDATEGKAAAARDSRPPREKSTPALERARAIISELFPDGIPGQAIEPNKKLCSRVGEKLKGNKLPGVSDDTILRAAGRRK